MTITISKANTGEVLASYSDRYHMTLTYHQDPGHGWLEVTDGMLADVGLGYLDFTRYSYKDGHRLYLEEDCDMGKFMFAYMAKYGIDPVLKEEYRHEDCFIRSLPRIPI